MSREKLSAHAVAEEVMKHVQVSKVSELITSTSRDATAIDQDTATFEINASIPEPKGARRGQAPLPFATYRVLIVRTGYQDPMEGE